MTAFPKISIVTPSFNQAGFLEQTICSVLEQGYPNLEYNIIDGGSTDESVDIIKKYADRLAYWVSEPDAGMYDALQKGMQRTSGDIMGWLNSDDMLHKNALYNVAEILSLRGVNWIQGQPNIFDELGRTVHVLPIVPWSKYRYLLNDYKWIQQESTYWTRDLWNKAGAHISTKYKYAGDMELWNRFFKYEKLFTPSCLIGGFRMRKKDQLSIEALDSYILEAEAVLRENVFTAEERNILDQIKKAESRLKLVYKTRVLSIPYITARLQQKKNLLYDFPPIINFSRKEQMFYCN